MPSPDIKMFLEMLTYKRPHESDSEKAFVKKFIDTVPGMTKDDFGNRWLTIGKNPITMFSAHVDTVHHKAGKQKIIYDKQSSTIYKDDGEPLGADDAAGVFAMLHMIKHKVEGLYVFHRGEECGGLGSRWIRDNMAHKLKGIEHCVAFDRKSTDHLITFQRGQRCCSDEFAHALATQFNKLGKSELLFKLNDTGVFTDSANYISLISECTNLSIGYYDEHTARELQDVEHLIAICNDLVLLNWNVLPSKRDITKKECKSYPKTKSWSQGSTKPKAKNNVSGFTQNPKVSTIGLSSDVPYRTFAAFIRAYPDACATLLGDLGVDMETLEEYAAEANDIVDRAFGKSSYGITDYDVFL